MDGQRRLHIVFILLPVFLLDPLYRQNTAGNLKDGSLAIRKRMLVLTHCTTDSSSPCGYNSVTCASFLKVGTTSLKQWGRCRCTGPVGPKGLFAHCTDLWITLALSWTCFSNYFALISCFFPMSFFCSLSHITHVWFMFLSIVECVYLRCCCRLYLHGVSVSHCTCAYDNRFDLILLLLFSITFILVLSCISQTFTFYLATQNIICPFSFMLPDTLFLQQFLLNLTFSYIIFHFLTFDTLT